MLCARDWLKCFSYTFRTHTFVLTHTLTYTSDIQAQTIYVKTYEGNVTASLPFRDKRNTAQTGYSDLPRVTQRVSKNQSPSWQADSRSSQWVTFGDTDVPELEQGTGLHVVCEGRLSQKCPRDSKTIHKRSEELSGRSGFRVPEAPTWQVWKLRPREIRAAGPTVAEVAVGEWSLHCNAHSQGWTQHPGRHTCLHLHMCFWGKAGWQAPC